MPGHAGDCAIALNIAGTPNITVTPWRSMWASTSWASNCGSSLTVPPFMIVGSVIMLRAATWNSGAQTKATSSAASSVSINTLMQFHVTLAWLSVAPLGRPVVPDV